MADATDLLGLLAECTDDLGLAPDDIALRLWPQLAQPIRAAASLLGKEHIKRHVAWAGEGPAVRWRITAAGRNWLAEERAHRRHHAAPVLPPIGSLWAAEGGYYAGIRRRTGAEPCDQHLVLAPAPPPTGGYSAHNASHPAALQAATRHAGPWADWSLPTRAEALILHANVAAALDQAAHWTADEDGPQQAYAVHMGSGVAAAQHRQMRALVRLVRRVPVKPSLEAAA